MADLNLSVATGPYDRVASLRLGEIKPEGITLDYHAQVPVHGIFVAMAEREAWDASEMSLALYTVKRASVFRNIANRQASGYAAFCAMNTASIPKLSSGSKAG